MSVRVDERTNKISMTRGDSARLAVAMTKDGEPYTPDVGDEIRFAVKHTKMTAGGKEFADPEPLFTKVIPVATMILELDPEDTKDLSFDTYAYDIQVTFANGMVDTFIPDDPTKIAYFVLGPEVD